MTALPGADTPLGLEEEHVSLLLENGSAEAALRELELPGKPRGALAAAPGPVRKWLTVSPDGQTSLLELDRLSVTQQLGVQLRDLRLLDPQLAASYPSALLARDRAIVLNLEFLKCIISLDAVLVTNLGDPLTLRFVSVLQRRLAERELLRDQRQREVPPGAGADAASRPPLAKHGGAHGALLQDLPFELRVLEAALEAVGGNLEQLAEELESTAHPALDALTGKVTTGALERVRRIKARMVRLNTRVETLREVLEKFLNDDEDMKDLNLTAKEWKRQEQQLGHSDSWDPEHLSLVPGALEFALDFERAAGPVGAPPREEAPRAGAGALAAPLPAPDAAPPPLAEEDAWEGIARNQARLPSQQSTGAASASARPKASGRAPGERAAASPTASRSSSSSSSSSTSIDSNAADVAVVEMLLEPYFMQLDNTFNKLQTLYEYVDDTEDFINIELDSKRNQIIRMQIILTSFNASIAIVTAMTSLFAMNLAMMPGDNWHGQGPYSWFVSISIASGVGALACFFAVLAFARYKRIL